MLVSPRPRLQRHQRGGGRVAILTVATRKCLVCVAAGARAARNVGLRDRIGMRRGSRSHIGMRRGHTRVCVLLYSSRTARLKKRRFHTPDRGMQPHNSAREQPSAPSARRSPATHRSTLHKLLSRTRPQRTRTPLASRGIASPTHTTKVTHGCTLSAPRQLRGPTGAQSAGRRCRSAEMPRGKTPKTGGSQRRL